MMLAQLPGLAPLENIVVFQSLNEILKAGPIDGWTLPLSIGYLGLSRRKTMSASRFSTLSVLS